MTDAPFSCSCGQVTGVLQGAEPGRSNHCACFCDSCRAGVVFGGEEQPASDPVKLVMTTSNNIKITKGAALLEPFTFGPRNLYRWRATCCGKMMFSAQRNPKTPVAAVLTRRLEDADVAGPVVSRAFVPRPGGKTRHENIQSFVKLMGRALKVRFTGTWKQTPFFDPATLAPIAQPVQISRDERRALLGKPAN